ncbi:hypothetical protein SPBR_09098 [Sporothrix brasiliensis 5110]|uniref:Uncharacterized protein n=1 Tax=Sporothrix brasiliensis 5110 TaxID=1398154 RepID=A0A0C2IWA7_9PEZI|nr:uncharacterized protein SPBR_09098 [Sporothrix brasiliensis 5110]KIH91070.1 hypothetical protein SPBR_09098 [Sporothrix brasiliensis 5110]
MSLLSDIITFNARRIAERQLTARLRLPKPSLFVDSLEANMAVENMTLKPFVLFGDDLIGRSGDSKQYGISSRLGA